MYVIAVRYTIMQSKSIFLHAYNSGILKKNCAYCIDADWWDTIRMHKNFINDNSELYFENLLVHFNAFTRCQKE